MAGAATEPQRDLRTGPEVGTEPNEFERMLASAKAQQELVARLAQPAAQTGDEATTRKRADADGPLAPQLEKSPQETDQERQSAVLAEVRKALAELSAGQNAQPEEPGGAKSAAEQPAAPSWGDRSVADVFLGGRAAGQRSFVDQATEFLYGAGRRENPTEAAYNAGDVGVEMDPRLPAVPATHADGPLLADPRVAELNQLAATEKERPLTAFEAGKQTLLEAELGPEFMRAWQEQQRDRQNRAEPEANSLMFREGGSGRGEGQYVLRNTANSGPEEGTSAGATERSKANKQGLKLEPTELKPNMYSLELGEGLTGDKIHFRRVREDMDQFGKVNIIGRLIRNANEAGGLFQTFRHAQYEVLHMVLMRGDVVVGRYAVSARNPSRTGLFAWEHDHAHLLQLMIEHGADGYWLVHNHPDGTPKPSDADMNSTQALANKIDGFKGHIILDHTKFAHIYRVGLSSLVSTYIDLPNTKGTLDPLLNPAPAEVQPVLGTKLETPEQQAQAAKWLVDQRDPQLVQLMILGEYKRVRALAELTPADLTNPQITRYIRNLAANQGGSHAVLYYEGSKDLSEVARSLVQKGVLMDAILPRQKSVAHELGDDKWDPEKGWMGLNDPDLLNFRREVKIERSPYWKPQAMEEGAGTGAK